MRLIECDRSYADQIQVIYNDVIRTSTSMFESNERNAGYMEHWFDVKEQAGYPVFGVVDEQNHLLAFGTYATFRQSSGYLHTVEHSIHVHRDHRGKGLGALVLHALIERATQAQYHCMMACIDSENTVSIHLHEKAGFTHCGHLKEVGIKFGTWRDLVMMQLLLSTSDASK